MLAVLLLVLHRKRDGLGVVDPLGQGLAALDRRELFAFGVELAPRDLHAFAEVFDAELRAHEGAFHFVDGGAAVGGGDAAVQEILDGGLQRFKHVLGYGMRDGILNFRPNASQMQNAEEECGTLDKS